MPLIAMTREMGSLGKDVAAGIAARHGRRVVYHEIIDLLADKLRLRKSHVVRLLEGRAGIWEQLTADKTSLAIFTADETFGFLRDGQTCVIRGWGAVHLLAKVPHVVRVRICAPLELRVDRMMERLGSADRDAVKKEVLLSEEAHTAITRRHFGIDWRDPELYDLILSTARMSVDECVEAVDSAMRLPRFQETRESLQVAEDLALEWNVRAALRRDRRTSAVSSGVTIHCRGGDVRLAGEIDAPSQSGVLEAVAAAVEGVRQVMADLRPATMGGTRVATT
jgi:cytidylate kinase